MLAKVSPRRRDGASDFSALIEYITDREEADLRAELVPADRVRHLELLERIGRQLEAASRQLADVHREFTFDTVDIRFRTSEPEDVDVRAASESRLVSASTSLQAAATHLVEVAGFQIDSTVVDRESQREILARAKNNLAIASGLLLAAWRADEFDVHDLRARIEGRIAPSSEVRGRDQVIAPLSGAWLHLRDAAAHLEAMLQVDAGFQQRAIERLNSVAGVSGSVNPTEEIDGERHTSDRGRDQRDVEDPGVHISGAGQDMRSSGSITPADEHAFRVGAQGSSKPADPDGKEHGGVEHHGPAGNRGELNGDQHQRSLATVRDHLRAAEANLRASPDFSTDFSESARARRAQIAFTVAANQAGDGIHAGNALEQLLSNRLLGEPEQVSVAGRVPSQHNCLTLATAAAEMKAVALMNTRVKDPLYHVVLSWPSDEAPTNDQAFQCGVYALNAVGMDGHQYVFGIHRDTENTHLHIAVNRVHPESYKAVYPERDFFKLDKAMRELELQFGWSHTAGPYAVHDRAGKKVVDWASGTVNTKEKVPSNAADMERHAAHESLFSYARGKPRVALLRALKNPELTWQQLHALLGKHGLEIREKGQGFAIYDVVRSTTPIKASDMHEELSKGRLVKRLGTFESSVQVDREMQYDKFAEPRRNPDEREERRLERANQRRLLKERYYKYRTTFVVKRLGAAEARARAQGLRTDARRQRAEIKATVTSAAARKALYSVVAFETLRARERLKFEIRQERLRLRTDPGNRCPTFRRWVETQAAEGDLAAISQLRGWAYERKRKIKKDGLNVLSQAGEHEPVIVDLPGFTHQVRRDGAIVYKTAEGKSVLLDEGSMIVVEASGIEPASVRSALVLARSKFGASHEVHGSDGFKAMVDAQTLELHNDERKQQVGPGMGQGARPR